MVPDQHFDRPGKSPFMDMDLVPKYADAVDAAGVSIDPRTVQNLGIRTAPAEAGALWRRIDTVGQVRPDSNRIHLVQTRVNGWIEALHIHAENDPVRRGQAVAEIFSPELLAAQEEFLLALREPGEADWLAAARQKLRLLGLSAAQIERLEQTRQAQRRVTYHAPVGGIVSRIAVHPGAAVNAGMPLMEITDLGRVWVTAEVVETQIGWIAPGKWAELRFPAWPGEVFEGRIDYVAPQLDPGTRTTAVRIVLDNPRGRLKPGMYANVTLFGGKGETGVIVPSEAVIRGGQRDYVLVALDAGRFEPVAVKTGIENGGQTLIQQGLTGGERVVVSGQFLIESEASLQGVLNRMRPVGAAGYSGTARVVKVGPASGELVMAHDPLPDLQWPAMTMPFTVADRALLVGLRPGQPVRFDIARRGEGFVVTALHPAP